MDDFNKNVKIQKEKKNKRKFWKNIPFFNKFSRIEISESQAIERKSIELLNINVPPKIFIRTNNDLDFNLPFDSLSGIKVLDLKMRFFSGIDFSTKNINLIFQGRILKDDELILKIGIKENNYLNAFITEKKLKNNIEIKSVSINEIPIEENNNLNVRPSNFMGFDRLQDLGFDQYEIIKQKYRFHLDFILNENEKELELDKFKAREEEWIIKNIEEITINKNHFQNERFFKKEINSTNEKYFNYFYFYLGIILGFFFNIGIIFLAVFIKQMGYHLRNGVFLGNIIKMCYVSIFFYLFGVFKWII